MHRVASIFLLALMFFGCVGQQQPEQAGNVSVPQEPAPAVTAKPVQQPSSVQQPVGTTLPAPQGSPYDFTSRSDDGRLVIYYFYSSYDCKPCEDMKPLVDSLKAEYGNSTKWLEFDLQAPGQGDIYWSMASQRKLPNCLRKIPAALVNGSNGTLVVGPIAMNKSLGIAINASLQQTN
jgi:thiol-disulfide isomerase/thioredoxin